MKPKRVFPKQTQALRSLFPTLLSVLIALVLVECLLFISERFFNVRKFQLIRQYNSESLLFSRTLPSEYPSYDPLLGWRNRPLPKDKYDFQESINTNGFRGRTPFHVPKTRRRIVLVGDSFTAGWKVNDSETIDRYLERQLSHNAEVINLGVRGFGIDQMALTAKFIAPELAPEIVVLNFIRPNLYRSCLAFKYGMPKPQFFWKNNGLEKISIPVPTLKTLKEKHTPLKQRLKNKAVTAFVGLRLFGLLTQSYLSRKIRSCVKNTNPQILKWLDQQLSHQGIRLLVMHLDQPLSANMTRKLQHSVRHFVSLPGTLEKLSQNTGLPIQRFEDGHPKASLNELYAIAIANSLREQQWLES